MDQPIYQIPNDDVSRESERRAAAEATPYTMPPAQYPAEPIPFAATEVASAPPPFGAGVLPDSAPGSFPPPAPAASDAPTASSAMFPPPAATPTFPPPADSGFPPAAAPMFPPPPTVASHAAPESSFPPPAAAPTFPPSASAPFPSADAAASFPTVAEGFPSSSSFGPPAGGSPLYDPTVPPAQDFSTPPPPIPFPTRPAPVNEEPAPVSEPAPTFAFVPPAESTPQHREPDPEPTPVAGAPAEIAPEVATATTVFAEVDNDLFGGIVFDEQASTSDADPDLLAALTEVLLNGASDLHVTVNAIPMLRVDGGLRPVAGLDVWRKDKVTAALRSILTDNQIAKFDEELELDLAYTLSSNARFRVNIYQQRNAMGAAFRLIPTDIVQLKDLGVPESVGRFATLPRGLVLVTGPTGSGKSTTLAALIDLVNRTRADHIVTVEDPIEFLHKNHKSLVNQREVGPDTHSFANALKHVLRQDPDVILIGELRDLETISVALTAAETGHLVFATLHTQDAAQTIDRVIDVFPPHQQGQVRSQLAATLQGVVCQTLVKRASGKGRVVATEVLVATPAINNLIREGKTYQIASAMQAGREHGMHTMDSHLADLANAGEITVRAAMEKAHDAESLGQLIRRTETATDAAVRAMTESGIDFGDAYSRKVD